MNICNKCNKSTSKRFYKNVQLCGTCYNKNLERNRIDKKCIYCNADKICRYKGPCCASCYAKYLNKPYYEKLIKRNKSRSYTKKSRFAQAKAEAKRRNIPWLIEKDDYFKLLAEKCVYCDKDKPSTGVGLDRLDNDKNIGYILKNVVRCCGSCNQIKGNNLTYSEMKAAMKAVIKWREINE